MHFSIGIMKNELIGGLLILLLLFLIESLDLIRMILLIAMKGSKKGRIFYWLSNVIFPPLNGKRLVALLLKSSSKSLCKLIENDEKILSIFGSVHEIKSEHFWIHLSISLIHLILLFVCLYLIDIDLLKIQKNEIINDSFEEEELDDDVYQERIDLLSEANYSEDALVCIDIVKKYSEKENLAINHLTFRVQQGQCFGLLGFNGAGLFYFSFYQNKRFLNTKVKHHYSK